MDLDHGVVTGRKTAPESKRKDILFARMWERQYHATCFFRGLSGGFGIHLFTNDLSKLYILGTDRCPLTRMRYFIRDNYKN